MREIRVVDNFLPLEEFKLIEDVFLHDKGDLWFPWYFAGHVGVTEEAESDGFYFIHNFIYLLLINIQQIVKTLFLLTNYSHNYSCVK